MSIIAKVATAGAVALALTAAGPGTQPAQAHDNGLGIGLGIAGGLILGGILANRPHYAPRYYGYSDYDYGPQPVCYPGPLQWRWERVCQPDYYGELQCRQVRNYYRPEVCN